MAVVKRNRDDSMDHQYKKKWLSTVRPAAVTVDYLQAQRAADRHNSVHSFA